MTHNHKELQLNRMLIVCSIINLLYVVSVGVLISGLVIAKTGLYVIDPIISLIIAAIILVPALKLLKQSMVK